jgi:hypothetical protein
LRHANGDAHIHPDGNSDGNGHIYSDGDCDGNAHTNSDGNCYGNGDCDRTAAAFTDTAASADTAASPLAFFGITGTREATREFPVGARKGTQPKSLTRARV